MKRTHFLSLLAAALLGCGVAGANTNVTGSASYKSGKSDLPEEYLGTNTAHASQGKATVSGVEIGGYEYLTMVCGGNSTFTCSNCTAEISGGNVMMLYGGSSGRDATENFVYMSGGNVAELYGAFGCGEVSNNIVIVTGGNIGGNSDYWLKKGYDPGGDPDLDGVYGGYSWVSERDMGKESYVASNNAVHLVGSGFTGEINGKEYSNTASIVINSGVHGGYSSISEQQPWRVFDNSIDIYGTGISAKYMSDMQKLTFHIVGSQAEESVPMITLTNELNLDELLMEPLHLMGETVTDWEAFKGKTITLIYDENGIEMTPASTSYIAHLAEQDPRFSDAASLYSIRNAKDETVATGILSVTDDGKSLVLSDITPGAQRLASHYISPPHSTTTRGLAYNFGIMFTSTEGQHRKEVVRVESDYYGTPVPYGEHDAQVFLLYNLHTNTNCLQPEYVFKTVNAESYELVVEGDYLQYTTIRNAVVANQPDPCSFLIHVASGYVAIEGLLVEAQGSTVEITAPDGIYFAALPHTDDLAKYYTGYSLYYYSDAEPGTNRFGTDTPLVLSSNGKITLGEKPQYGEGTHVLNGQWTINYTGSKGEDWDVDILCKVVGGLNVTAREGGVNAGIVEGNATVEARDIYLTSLWNGNVSFRATESVTIMGVDTSGYVEVGGIDSARPEITVNGDLIAKEHVRLTGAEVAIGGGLCALNNDACIESTGGVGIGTFSETYPSTTSFIGGTLNVTAGGDVAIEGYIASTGTGKWKEDGTSGGIYDIRLQGAGIAAKDINSVDAAYLRGVDGDITINTYTGGSLKASANGDMFITSIASTGTGRWNEDGTAGGDCAIYLQGNSIDIEQYLSSNNAISLKSTGSDPDEAHIKIKGIMTTKASASLASTGYVGINSFIGGSINVSAGSDVSISGDIETTGPGKWNEDGTAGGGYTVRLQGAGIAAIGIDTDAAWLRSTDGDITFYSFSGDTLKASAAGDIAVGGNVRIKGEGESRISVAPDYTVQINGKLNVDKGTLNIMNISEAANLSVADVTIGNGATMGVYTGEADEGTLTIAGNCTLTAGAGATLNANLVMEEGSTLDVSAARGGGGLLMGSAVTMSPGSVALSAADMAAVDNLGFMQAYDLFSGVDSFSIGGTAYSEITFSDEWVKAAEVFNNDLFQDGGKEYYLFYSGASQGGAGGNAGAVYLMQVPEPATSTLGLLALAALAARRRRK